VYGLFCAPFSMQINGIIIKPRTAFDNRYKIAFNLGNCRAIFYGFYWRYEREWLMLGLPFASSNYECDLKD